MNCPCPTHSPGNAADDHVGPGFVGMIDGRPVLGHRTLSDGKALCQLCFDYFWPCELHEHEGQRSDICVACAEVEATTWRCPRCHRVITDADSRLYEFCPHCDDFTGTRAAHEVCAIHRAYEPSAPGDYSACGECLHVWRTEQDFIDDVLADRVNHAEAMLRYEGIIVDTAAYGPPLEQPFCPLCSHDF
jgi:hypothetical protein